VKERKRSWSWNLEEREREKSEDKGKDRKLNPGQPFSSESVEASKKAEIFSNTSLAETGSDEMTVEKERKGKRRTR
jgi:hypothetical protein